MTLELNVYFSGPNALDLPWLYEKSTAEDTYFIDDGIELKCRETSQASLESSPSYMVSFMINVIDISASAITISNFLYQKIKNYKNAKTRIGSHEIRYDVNHFELHKIIREELEKLKDENR